MWVTDSSPRSAASWAYTVLSEVSVACTRFRGLFRDVPSKVLTSYSGLAGSHPGSSVWDR